MTQCLTNTDVGHYQWIFLNCQLYNGPLMFNYFELCKCIIKRNKTPTILCCVVLWGGGGAATHNFNDLSCENFVVHIL